MKFLAQAFAAFVAIAIAASAPSAAQDNAAYRVDGMMPYLAFDKLEPTKLEMPGGEMRVAFAPGEFNVGKQAVLDWVKRSGDAVAAYYGKFPVPSARVLIVPSDGAKTEGGQAFGNAGAAVRLMVGREIIKDALAQDWQLTHELTHLAFPNVAKQTWISEGMAVYVEPIARVQSGDLTEAYVWGDFVKLLPMGLPKPGDMGLDKTEERDRIYSGGAMFWLVADLEIRKQTDNRVGVQDALRGVLQAGGAIEDVWSGGRAMSVADMATGKKVLTDMYDIWRRYPVTPKLDGIWRDLGVNVVNGDVTLDDSAPLAAVRKAIVAKRPLG